jgi:hypothetical protein
VKKPSIKEALGETLGPEDIDVPDEGEDEGGPADGGQALLDAIASKDAAGVADAVKALVEMFSA